MSVVSCVLLLAIAFCQPVFAQDGTTRLVPDGQWQPFGAIPVDQAGAGRRGYAFPGESADVTPSGENQIALHAVASNNFFREETGAFLITQRYETHTLGLDVRRGLKIGRVPRFELGAQVQLSERDGGFLNGFISGFESLCLSLSGVEAAKNQWRTGPATLPQGTLMTKDGRTIYRGAGNGAGPGDVSFVAKMLLRDGAPSSRTTRVAVRIGVNASAASAFAEGNFAGLGASVERKLLRWTAFHGDVRATLPLDRVSQWNLPLRRRAFGFSAGQEFRLSSHSSGTVQLDGHTTPYLPTGTTAFDKGYGSITMGFGHRFTKGRNTLVSQIYVRENMNLPFRVRWNVDPDASFGIKFTIRPALHLER